VVDVRSGRARTEDVERLAERPRLDDERVEVAVRGLGLGEEVEPFAAIRPPPTATSRAPLSKGVSLSLARWTATGVSRRSACPTSSRYASGPGRKSNDSLAATAAWNSLPLNPSRKWPVSPSAS
jgi:hypothetical protein